MHPTKRKALYASLALAGAWPLVGQEAAPAPAATTPPAATEEDVVVLSPFEVTAESDTGYVATDTLAGTRIRSDLKDIGSAISVVTKDLMNDIGATDASTLLQYTTNTEVAGTHGTYSALNGDVVENLRTPASAQRVRGLAAADTTRDYFVTDIPWDSYNVDRIDILRGPNSFLFGLGSPSGIQNASMQSATYKNRGTAEYRIGSYGSQRATLNVNQVLIDDVLAIRVAGLWDHENFQQTPAFENDERVYGTMRWDPKLFKNPAFKTSIKVKYEAGDIDANRPRTVTPFDRITPWYLPAKTAQQIKDDWGKDTVNPFGGLGRAIAFDPYSVERSDNIVKGDGFGVIPATSVNYNPWMGTAVNAQQPYYTIEGSNGTVYDLRGGWINAGALSSNGQLTGAASGVPNKRYSGSVYVINGLSGRANASGNVLPLAQYGGYRDQGLTDASIFDFYNNLIDGPNKSEWQRWTAYNIDFSQTGWDDRVGINLIYDRQRSTSGNEGLFGWGPTLNIDLLANYDDYYYNQANAVNYNFGRPFVATNANGTDVFTDREYKRASVFAELRVSDLTDNKFLIKLLGKHRFNGVYSSEKYDTNKHGYLLYSNSQAWAGYWNGTDGSTSPIGDRVATGLVYLGQQITNRSEAAGANIPRVDSIVDLPDGGIYVFDPTPKAGITSAYMATPWTRPNSLENIIGLNANGTPLTQASNLDNLVGWNDNFAFELVRGAGGKNTDTWTSASKALKKTTSWAGSYQGFFWNDALVSTIGWRYDKVKSWAVSAAQIPNQRSKLNLTTEKVNVANPYVYGDPNVAADHSFNYQGVLHLNRILKKDLLPINVSLSYAKADNFEVTSVRRDLYGNAIDNPSGETEEYGVLLATKDGKFSLRAVKFETKVLNASAALANGSALGGIISNGLNWRNVFLYQLGAYDLNSKGQDSYRNRWTNAYPSYIQYKDANGVTQTYADGTPEFEAGVAKANARRDEAIRGWNEIQTWLTAKGFFSGQAWNFTPLGPDAALVDRATYLSNPTQYAPSANTVTQYKATPPSGFNVTSDTISKGYEFEATYNPLPNWRIAFNASKTEATRVNVGGATLSEFITYMDSMLIDPSSATGYTAAGEVPRWGGAGAAIGNSVYAPWKANFTKMKLQEGTQSDEIRKWRFNVITNYSFNEGRLKGVGVGAAYRWQDRQVLGYPVTAEGGYDLSKPYYGPSEDSVDLWVSYERKLTSKINWKVQFNIRNLFGDDSLIPVAVQPDGYTWATVRVAPNREWFLTNTFNF